MADYGDSSITRDVAGKIERSTEKLQQKSATITSHAANKIHDVADKVGSVDMDEYRNRVREMVDNAKCEVDKNVKNVESGIKDHPFESIAIAAGVGLLMGAAISHMGRRAVDRKMSEMR
ncbi:MAG TPA: DUF883 C-terminal domain-containing protein [Methanocellaceae archaeon]|jgi:ElaB/YqjD/DUF883 family membrane-anchored ribosome-binding protein